MRVIFTEAAEAELVEIAVGIAKTSPSRAGRIFKALRLACEGLSDMPHRFQLAPGYESKGVRRRVVEQFLIFYRVGDATVQILHIFHGADAYAAHLLLEE